MKTQDLNASMRQIEFTGDVRIVRDDWQAKLECRGTYNQRTGEYTGGERKEGHNTVWIVQTPGWSESFDDLAAAVANAKDRGAKRVKSAF